ncbi:MAG: hypothetical protein OEX07_16200 [Gammaproteobacteria bacterium]|nr:hypothetical protein [Gammaproteobacteria bacterium]
MPVNDWPQADIQTLSQLADTSTKISIEVNSGASLLPALMSLL